MLTRLFSTSQLRCQKLRRTYMNDAAHVDWSQVVLFGLDGQVPVQFPELLLAVLIRTGVFSVSLITCRRSILVSYESFHRFSSTLCSQLLRFPSFLLIYTQAKKETQQLYRYHVLNIDNTKWKSQNGKIKKTKTRSKLTQCDDQSQLCVHLWLKRGWLQTAGRLYCVRSTLSIIWRKDKTCVESSLPVWQCLKDPL